MSVPAPKAVNPDTWKIPTEARYMVLSENQVPLDKGLMKEACDALEAERHKNPDLNEKWLVLSGKDWSAITPPIGTDMKSIPDIRAVLQSGDCVTYVTEASQTDTHLI